jgi:hypothetical protein
MFSICRDVFKASEKFSFLTRFCEKEVDFEVELKKPLNVSIYLWIFKHFESIDIHPANRNAELPGGFVEFLANK